MGEKRWKISTTKDTMLHILNNIFKQNVKEYEVMARTEYYWDEKTESFFEYLKSRNERLKKEHFELFVKQNELGEDVLQELMMIAFIFNEKMQKNLDISFWNGTIILHNIC